MTALASLVIDAQTLAEVLTQSPDDVTVLDVRPGEEFAKGHIPRAAHLDPGLLNRAEKPVGGLLPDAASVAEWAGNLGLTPGSTIAVYDAGKATAAARAVWVLNAYGFNQVHWLDGGFSAWQAHSLPISIEPSVVAATNTQSVLLSSLEKNNDVVLDNAELTERLSLPADSARHPQAIDTRTRGEFEGTDVRSARGGHMPSAVHYEWLDMFAENGTLKPNDELMTELNKRHIDKDKTCVVYCQTHQRSAVTYVVLKHLGFNNVAALDGAWSSWGNDPTTAIES